MNQKIYYVAIRREDKSVWQRRAPLVPAHVKEILQKYHDIKIIVQPSQKRIFSDFQYKESGAIIQQELDKADLILGIKQIPPDKFIPNKTYMIFSHTMKAQPHNMPALDKMLENRIRLIDYEKITDENNNRLIAFGRYAGIAGAIDFLKGFGQYIMQMGISTPFLNINCSYKYFNMEEAFEHLKAVGLKIKQKAIPEQLRPMIFAVTGRGRTAKGCFEVLQNLPITYIKLQQLAQLCHDTHNPTHQHTIYIVNINTQDIMIPRDPQLKFSKHDYYTTPGKYRNTFHQRVLPYITVLFHCIYWDKHYPRYIRNKYLKELAQQKRLRLLGVCDISCDLNGSIECLTQYTRPQRPFFYYHSLRQQKSFDNNYYEYGKIIYLAIDFLPSELAYDASMEFSCRLKNWIPQIVKSDANLPFEQQLLVPELKRAMVTLNGELTPNFRYIEKMRLQNNSFVNTIIVKKEKEVVKQEVGQTSSSSMNQNINVISLANIIPLALNFTEEEQLDQTIHEQNQK